MPTVREELYRTSLARGLRQGTVLSYKRLLAQAGLLDMDAAEVTFEVASNALFGIDNTNTRRAAAVAVRSVLGLKVRIPVAVPRHYDLPSEGTLRLALTLSIHSDLGLGGAAN